VTAVLLFVAPSNGRPQRIVEARAGEVVYRDTFDPNSATSRRRFVSALAEKLAVDAAELVAVDEQIVTEADSADAAVERAAAEAAQQQAATSPSCSGAWPEINPSRIIRPERFIAPTASGLSIPVLSEIEGRVVGRWLIFLRHADGRRESRALSGNIDLGENHRLFVHPKPCEPSGSFSCGWSAEARRAWLQGAAAPDPAELFERLTVQIFRFIDLPLDRSIGITATLALWVMLSYIYHAWPAVPYLFVGGPAHSGKTRVFEVLSRLVFRPLTSSNLTAAALFRTLHDRGGTLLLDEAERLRQANDPATGDLLSMLLAGYKRGGKATRLEPVGDSFKTVAFDVFGPKALACIAGLPTALASRCISLTMFRAPPDSDKPRLRIDADSAGWQTLQDDLHSLALEHGATWLDLAQRTDVCPAMSGRDFEMWQPLLALAAWIESHGANGLRGLVEAHALSTIESGRDDQTPDADETLLRILANALRNGERQTPGEILAKAKQLEPEGFKHWGARGVSSHLKRYGLETRKSHGERVYGPELTEMLGKIQQSYGIELGADG
jgi:hypothetical protein